MVLSNRKKCVLYLLLLMPFMLHAQSIKMITNHVGYEDTEAKHAVIVADSLLVFSSFSLVDANTAE